MIVRKLIDSKFNQLSASERRIAKVITERYPVSALGGIEDIAERASVSPPTVTRFAKRLGFDRFNDFQRAIRSEVQDNDSSPLALFDRYHQSGADGGILADLAASVVRLEDDPAATAITQSVEIISACRGRIYCAGGRWSSVAAQYLAFQLATMRGEVHALLPQASGLWVDRLCDIKRSDILVLYDFRRYQEEMFAVAEIVRARGAKIVLVTDLDLSPICELAEVTLPVAVATTSPLDTLVPAIAATDAILVALVDVYKDRSSARMKRLEEVRQKTGAGANLDLRQWPK
ncbi:MurR/RpiR family transcriptional regulator [Oceaniradius stylonematis]|uniref:MurR/RpiR family transcriptional regulator n=1 Tax=Oceaniradius stylonematis TaxID=2184161 RepID=UPI00273DD7B7|nr:MurR/RpiR family transcriptional regulator [Oceaniradius stylonematis]